MKVWKNDFFVFLSKKRQNCHFSDKKSFCRLFLLFLSFCRDKKNFFVIFYFFVVFYFFVILMRLKNIFCHFFDIFCHPPSKMSWAKKALSFATLINPNQVPSSVLP